MAKKDGNKTEMKNIILCVCKDCNGLVAQKSCRKCPRCGGINIKNIEKPKKENK